MHGISSKLIIETFANKFKMRRIAKLTSKDDLIYGNSI